MSERSPIFMINQLVHTPLFSAIGATPVWVLWTFFLAIVLVSGLVHGFVGVGFPMVATPIFALVLGFREAVVSLVIPTVLVTVGIVWANRNVMTLRDQIRSEWPIWLTMPIGVVVGVQAMFWLDPRVLMIGLAVVITGYLIIQRGKPAGSAWFKNNQSWLSFVFGFIAGFTEGSVNVAGPVFLIYYLLLDMPVQRMIATVSYFFLAGKSIQTGLLFMRGQIDWSIVWFAIPLTIVGTLGLFLGLYWRKKYDPARYRTWLLYTLWVVVAILLSRVAMGA